MEVINIGIGIVLNFASIMTVTVVTPLLITLTGEILTAFTLFVIGLALMALVWIPFAGPFLYASGVAFEGIAAATTLTAVGTALLLALALFFGALLIKIQNDAKEKSFGSSVLSGKK